MIGLRAILDISGGEIIKLHGLELSESVSDI